jgi:hypothetical protein
MTYTEAKSILDSRKEGADMPDAVVNLALELTGDLRVNRILAPSDTQSENIRVE